jgi:hypothetical protein
MQPDLTGRLRNVGRGDRERLVCSETLVARGAARIRDGDAQARGHLSELRREVREQDAIVAEVDGVVIAVTAEVKNERDLVAAVLLSLGTRAVDSGEELRARWLGEHERVLGLHAAQAHHDVADARGVGRRELQRALGGEPQLAPGRHEDAHGLRLRHSRPARDGERGGRGRDS